MPTYRALPRFKRDHRKLNSEQAKLFRKALELFLDGLRSGGGSFDPRLRVHRIAATEDIWSLSWSEDGRATFQYGKPLREGEPHIIWRRVGDHSIYRGP